MGGAIGFGIRGSTVTHRLVSHRIHGDLAVPAVQVDRLLMRDEDYHRHHGPRRYFWLLDEGVQLVYEPFGWAKEWYVDIVSFETLPPPECFPGYPVMTRVHDRWIDVVVEGMGPTYRVVDLDELAAAMSNGDIPVAVAAEALATAQRFVDVNLHRGAPFPPLALEPFFAADHQYPPLPS